MKKSIFPPIFHKHSRVSSIFWSDSTCVMCIQLFFSQNHKSFEYLISTKKDRGFCVRGNNKETACGGDSGSPAILKKNKKNYLIGIAFRAQKKCGKMFLRSSNGLPKKSVSPSKYVAVPGKLMKWLLKEVGNDIKKQQNNCKCHHQKVTAV